jgi:lipooligosaccharide transport system permease protein
MNHRPAVLAALLLTLPRLSWRFVPVWRRNFFVWRKLAGPSILGNLTDPLLYMLGLGYGLGALLPEVNGIPYLAFLAGGTLAYSTMNSATFEATYSSFSRMHVQKTWEALLNAPLTIDDVLLGEWIWIATKSLFSGLAILLIIWLLGLYSNWALTLWLIPLVFLSGLTFGGLGLVMTSLSPSFDFFLYYFSLVVTPMMLLSGVFFPVTQLPEFLQMVSAILPLAHVIDIVRPVLRGDIPADGWQHGLILLAWAMSAFWLALTLTRKRLLS